MQSDEVLYVLVTPDSVEAAPFGMVRQKKEVDWYTVGLGNGERAIVVFTSLNTASAFLKKNGIKESQTKPLVLENPMDVIKTLEPLVDDIPRCIIDEVDLNEAKVRDLKALLKVARVKLNRMLR